MVFPVKSWAARKAATGGAIVLNQLGVPSKMVLYGAMSHFSASPRLIPFAGFLFGLGLAGIVIVRVCLSRFDFKQRPVCSFLNVLCQLTGVPLIGKVRNQCFIHNTILQMMVLFC